MFKTAARRQAANGPSQPETAGRKEETPTRAARNDPAPKTNPNFDVFFLFAFIINDSAPEGPNMARRNFRVN